MISVRDATVPDDRVLGSTHRFEPVGPLACVELFNIMHETSERIYNGDGSWGHGFVHDESSVRWRALFAKPEDYVEWPTVRDCGRRLAGYARALDVSRNSRYLERLAAGIEWLLRQQLADGAFPWWVSRTGMPDTDHLFYVSAYAVVGLLEASRHSPSDRVLPAVRRAADWVVTRAHSPNTNYNAFACWVLVAAHRAFSDRRYLEAAVRMAVDGILPGQLANGGWAGHNSWVFYQGITVSGLAVLAAALSRDHRLFRTIESCLYRAVNNLVIRQHDDGTSLSTFDEQEWEEAQRRQIGCEKHPRSAADPHAVIALVWLHELLGFPVENVIHGHLAAYRSAILANAPYLELATSHGEHDMAVGCAWRWAARRAGATPAHDTRNTRRDDEH